MATFDPTIIDAAKREREVTLTTFGRKSGTPSSKIIWIASDGEHLYIRSGGGLGRDWPQNFLTHNRGVLEIDGREVPVCPRHLTDPAEARKVSALVSEKYGTTSTASSGDEPLTPGEQASFELLPAE